LTGKGVDIWIPANALYENTLVDWEEGKTLFRGDSIYYAGWTSKDVIWAEKPTWHLQSKKEWKDKMGWYHEATGDWKKVDSLGNARMKWPGRNYLVVDTIPPVVERKDQRVLTKEFSPHSSAFYASIEDALSGINKVDGFVDGQWIMLGYDAKNKLVYLDPQFVFTQPMIQLQVVAEDPMGNRSINVFEVVKPAVK